MCSQQSKGDRQETNLLVVMSHEFSEDTERTQVGDPFSVLFGSGSVSDFRLLNIFPIHNDISWGVGPKSQHRIHFCFLYTSFA